MLYVPDGDGQIEMAVTYADRAVRTFRWQIGGGEGNAQSKGSCPGHLQLVDKWQLAGQVGNFYTHRALTSPLDQAPWPRQCGA